MATDSQATQGGFWLAIGLAIVALSGTLYSSVQGVMWLFELWRYISFEDDHPCRECLLNILSVISRHRAGLAPPTSGPAAEAVITDRPAPPSTATITEAVTYAVNKTLNSFSKPPTTDTITAAVTAAINTAVTTAVNNALASAPVPATAADVADALTTAFAGADAATTLAIENAVLHERVRGLKTTLASEKARADKERSIGNEERKMGERAVARERERAWAEAEAGRGPRPFGFRVAVGREFGGESVREGQRNVSG
ncbi:hypothetical protein MMC11_008559 [Xylographa trunciseda]|nr:hypothetical protein [Xylographa trunciseda]